MRYNQLVWLYSSQGAQWVSMGQCLFKRERLFQEVIEQCDNEIRKYLNWSLITEFTKSGANYRLHRDPICIQPSVTAIQIALSRILQSHGIEPHAVGGLSMGEVAATHIAGVLSLQDAMCVVCCQAQLTSYPLRPGKMLIVNLSAEQAVRYFNELDRKVAIATEFSPSLTVVSGEASSIDRLASILQAKSIYTDVIPIPFAYHTSEIEPLRSRFFDLLKDITPQDGHLPVYSSVTGNLHSARLYDANHWWQIMSQTAYFTRLVTSMFRNNYHLFLDIGPHPTLTPAIAEVAKLMNFQIDIQPVMVRDKNDCEVLDNTLNLLRI